MEHKDLNYDFFPKELVDLAKDFAKSYYKENHFISDVKCLELAAKLTDVSEEHKTRTQHLIYTQMLERIESAYLYGMQYAVSHEISSTKPTHESQLCQYQKDKDFAFVFKFGDNDFSNHFEHAAKLYCDAYNRLLQTINTYTEYAPEFVKRYIQDVDNIEKRKVIIESLKIGVASYSFQSDIDTYHPEIMSFEKSMRDTNHYVNDYFDFEGEIQLWEKDENGEYCASGSEPRLVIGTRAEIEESLKTYGTPDEENSMPREFPYWCNSETLIVYMREGFLYYVIR